MPDPTAPRSPRAASVTSAAALAALGALGAAFMAVAHLGVDLPLLPTQGLGRAVPAAAAAFTIGTVLFALAARGLLRQARWAWWLALAGFAIALQGSAMPYRGPGSAVGITLSVLGLACLLAPGARRLARTRD